MEGLTKICSFHGSSKGCLGLRSAFRAKFWPGNAFLKILGELFTLTFTTVTVLKKSVVQDSLIRCFMMNPDPDTIAGFLQQHSALKP